MNDTKMKTAVNGNLKKYDVRRITFHGKIVVQQYNGQYWATLYKI